MTELEAKKQHATIVGDLESDFESDEKSATEWQPRDKKRETKTPASRRRVRLTNEKKDR